MVGDDFLALSDFLLGDFLRSIVLTDLVGLRKLLPEGLLDGLAKSETLALTASPPEEEGGCFSLDLRMLLEADFLPELFGAGGCSFISNATFRPVISPKGKMQLSNTRMVCILNSSNKISENNNNILANVAATKVHLRLRFRPI